LLASEQLVHSLLEESVVSLHMVIVQRFQRFK